MTTNASAGGSTGTVAASNKLSAALFELRKYYAMMGRGDLLEIKALGIAPEGGAFDLWTETTVPEGEEYVYTAKVGIPTDVIEQLMFTLMDNTEGAHFTKDLVQDTRLLSRFSVATAAADSAGILSLASISSGGEDDYTGVNNYVQILMEPQQIPETADLPFWISDVIKGPHLLTPDEAESYDGTDMASLLLLVDTVPYEAEGQEVGGGPGFALNKDIKNPNRYTSPTLAVYLFPNQKLSQATRGTSGVSLFANAIPTVEMSRCVPHIDIKFISALPPGLGDKTNQISLLRFLGMSSTDNDGINLEGALPQNLASKFQLIQSETDAVGLVGGEEGAVVVIDDLSTSISSAGMELFTAPQTLVNADINKGGSKQILNTLAPFMTLNSLKIRISGLNNALLSNKTGTLSFTLHDRSRMADIAPLIAVDLFAQSYLTVEWGWSHPDGDDATTNAYGALLNSLRSKSQFNIVASNWRISNDGQVNIDMRLVTRGGSEVRSFPISTGRLMPIAPFKSIVSQYLASLLQTAKDDVPANEAGEQTLREINERMTVSMTAADSPSTVVERSVFDTFMGYIQPVEGGATVTPQEFVDAITALVGDPTDATSTGTIQTSNSSSAKEVNRKMGQLAMTPDPFWPPLAEDDVATPIKQEIDASDGTANYQTLGKIISQFVGVPLAATGRFDEVQLMFYRFNGLSGAARDLPTIASFLVSFDKLRNLLTGPGGYVESNPGMSIFGFINILNDEVIGDPASVNYGLTSLRNQVSEASAESETEDTEEARQAAQTEIKTLDEQVTARLEQIYSTGEPCQPVFKLPKLTMTFEALPALVAKDEDSPFIPDESKIILKVHIWDASATPHDSEMFLMTCMNDKQMAIRIKNTTVLANAETVDATVDIAPEQGNRSGTVEDGIEADIVVDPADPASAESSANKYQAVVSNVPNTELKRIIKMTVPSLTYGLGFSALNSFSVQSTTGGQVANATLMNALLAADKPVDAGGSPNETPDLEDITVIPASATMELQGCPLLEYGQQFFIDLGTGTTADNIYRVINIEHTLSAGEFRSSVSLGYQGSGILSTLRSTLVAAQPTLAKILESQ